MRKVIAIAAPVGGGKSSLVAALSRALDDAPILRFDDYQHATRQSVPQLEAWLASGADFDALQAPGLAEALSALKQDDGRWAVFEMPLGREYTATAGNIDWLVWLDLPLDIALARKLRELASAASAGPAEGARNALRWIDDYLGHYIRTIHRVLALQKQRVPAKADFVLDGQLDTAVLVETLLAQMGVRR